MPRITSSISGNIDSNRIIAAGIAKKQNLCDVRSIDIAHIVETKNIRFVYDDESIHELARSIKEYGLLQPVSVREMEPDTEGQPRYDMIAGHRRLRAYQHLCATETQFSPLINAVIIEPKTEQDKLVIQLIENLQREDLSSPEREKAIVSLAETGIKQRDIANLISKNEAYVSRHIRAYKMRQLLQEKGVDGNGIETSVLYAFTSVSDEDLPKLANQLLQIGVSRANAEALLDAHKTESNERGLLSEPVQPAQSAEADAADKPNPSSPARTEPGKPIPASPEPEKREEKWASENAQKQEKTENSERYTDDDAPAPPTVTVTLREIGLFIFEYQQRQEKLGKKDFAKAAEELHALLYERFGENA
jgi:ParB family chromosome partitioning protein